MTFAHDPSLDFDLHQDNANPSGLVEVGDKFYVFDSADRKIYVYTKAGVRIPAEDSGVLSIRTRTELAQRFTERFAGIGSVGNFIWAIGETTNRSRSSYAYYYWQFVPNIGRGISFGRRTAITSGTSTRFSFDTVFSINNSNYLIDSRADGIFHISNIGGSPLFSLASQTTAPNAAAASGDKVYIGDANNGMVFVYQLQSSGFVHLPDEALNLNRLTGATVQIEGLAISDDQLFVLDRSSDKVYGFGPPQPGSQVRLGGLTVLAAPTAKLPDPSATIRMGGVSIDAALRLGRPAQVAAETRLGGLAITAEPTVGIPPPSRFATPFAHVTADRFSIDRTVIEEPDSMAGEGDRLYILDWLNRRVTVYLTDGTRQSSQDFTLDDAHRLPRSITVVEGIIYIADGSRKVFAYNRAGVRQPDLEFALDPENGSIAGLTTARGIRFYVGDWDDDMIYAHTIAGERIPDEDFPLHEANADPGAMTAIGNRLYVSDTFGGGIVGGQQRTIFVYSTGGRALEREFISTGNAPRFPVGIWGEGPNLWILDSGAVYHWAQPHAATRLGGLTVQAAPSERLPSASVRLGGLTVQAALAGLRRGQAEFVVDALISYLRRALPAAWDDTNRVQPADRRFALSTEEGYRPYTIQTLPVLTGRVYPVVSVAVLRYTQDEANFGGSENIWEYEVAIEVADNILINRRGDEVSSFLAAQSNPENLHRLVSRHAESIRDALEADYTVGGSFITTFVEEINLSGVITQDQSHVQAAALDVTVRSQHLAKGV